MISLSSATKVDFWGGSLVLVCSCGEPYKPTPQREGAEVIEWLELH
jgi:hypothetical protein